MAIPTTYATLQTELVDWIKRDDQTDRLTLYIAMAESAMNARLRLRIMEATDNVTLSTGYTTATLPTRFLEPVSLAYTDGDSPLVQKAVDEVAATRAYASTVSSGRPIWYAYSASTIDFNCASDDDYTLSLKYIKKLDLAADTTNDVLTAAPFSYLYGAMCSYFRWAEDGENLAQYTALFQQELRQLEELDRGSRGSVLARTDLPELFG